MRSIISTVIAVALLASDTSAGERLPLATEIVQNAKRDCNSFEKGVFHSTEQTITLHDFTGDGRPEEVVDASQFSCSSALTLWGGTGGTYLWVIVDNQAHEFLAHSWQIVDADGQKVLLLAVHSSECSYSIGPCYRAFVWQDGFRTTR